MNDLATRLRALADRLDAAEPQPEITEESIRQRIEDLEGGVRWLLEDAAVREVLGTIEYGTASATLTCRSYGGVWVSPL